MDLWESIDDALGDEEKVQWNEWRRGLWEKAQDLDVAAHQCPLENCSRGESISDLSNGLMSAVGEVPVFDVKDAPEVHPSAAR